MLDEIRDAIYECASTLGFCAGAQGNQPRFDLFDDIKPEEVRKEAMRLYLADYREGLALVGAIH